MLVALAIVAVALSAGMRALAQSADGATLLKARTLALWVAENRLARAQLADPAPAAGRGRQKCRRASRSHGDKRSTRHANPAFRRVEIVVDATRPARITRLRDLSAMSAMGNADRRDGHGLRQRAGADDAFAARGFTLVEALVAIAILGLVAVLAWRATAAMTDNEVRLAAEARSWQQLDAVLTRVEADLRSSVPRPARHGAGSKDAAWSLAPSDAAGNALLIFTRAGPNAIDEPGTGGQRVGYRWRNGHVEALYWPHIDNVVTRRCRRAIALSDDVARFRVSRAHADNRWSDHGRCPGSTRHSARRPRRAAARRRQLVERCSFCNERP